MDFKTKLRGIRDSSKPIDNDYCFRIKADFLYSTVKEKLEYRASIDIDTNKLYVIIAIYIGKNATAEIPGIGFVPDNSCYRDHEIGSFYSNSKNLVDKTYDYLKNKCENDGIAVSIIKIKHKYSYKKSDVFMFSINI